MYQATLVVRASNQRICGLEIKLTAFRDVMYVLALVVSCLLYYAVFCQYYLCIPMRSCVCVCQQITR